MGGQVIHAFGVPEGSPDVHIIAAVGRLEMDRPDAPVILENTVPKVLVEPADLEGIGPADIDFESLQ